MAKARIGNRHPVRASLNDVPSYWDNAVEALNLIAQYLQDHGFNLGEHCTIDKSGTLTIPIVVDRESGLVCIECDKPVECESVLVFQTYTMPSGKTEVTTYIS
jgi:hypothetical protein